MYKVFINNKRLILANNEETIDSKGSTIICLKEPSSVNRVIRTHLMNPDNIDLVILSSDLKTTIKAFESNYEIRIAAGGWVWNINQELLMIFRGGFWDIPKGHLEEGEKIEECALREVTEETGLTLLKLDKSIGISRHIYEHKGKMVLKLTHWHTMSTEIDERLIPQTEEGIEEVVWVANGKVDEYLEKSWHSLREFYNDFQNIIGSNR